MDEQADRPYTPPEIAGSPVNRWNKWSKSFSDRAKRFSLRRSLVIIELSFIRIFVQMDLLLLVVVVHSSVTRNALGLSRKVGRKCCVAEYN